MRTYLFFLLVVLVFRPVFAGDIIRLWPVEVNGKWGYIDEYGKIAVEPQFDSAAVFVRAIARVRIGDKWGGLTWGGVRVPVEFDYVGTSLPMPVRKDGIWGIWSYYYPDGSTHRDTLIYTAFDSIGDFDSQTAFVIQNGKWGVINSDALLVVPAVNDTLVRPDYNPDFTPLMAHDIHELFAAKRDGRWGLITGEDSVLIPFAYDSVVMGTQSQLVAVKVGDKWGFADFSGTTRIEPQFDATRGFERSFSYPFGSWGFGTPAAAVSRDGKWGFIDTTGHEIIPLQHENVGRIGQSRIAVQIADKWGYLDSAGVLAIPAQFDSAGTIGAWGAVKVDGKYGFISDKGKWMVRPEFDAVDEVPHGGFIVRKANRYGFVIPRGKKVIIGWYDAVTPFYAGYARVRNGDRWQYVSTNGKVLWP